MVSCNRLLLATPSLLEARYGVAAAHIGIIVTKPEWQQSNRRSTMLAPAVEAYQRAMEISRASGVVDAALGLLSGFESAGVSGLEPFFEQLRSSPS